jgi:hypothetical protein
MCYQSRGLLVLLSQFPPFSFLQILTPSKALQLLLPRHRLQTCSQYINNAASHSSRPLPLLLPSFALAISEKGEVSLWSNFDCGRSDPTSFGERSPVALKCTRGADTCSAFGATAHSYTVLRRPT